LYSYGPMLGIVIAFQKFIPAFGIFRSSWAGLDNFRYVMSMPDSMRSLQNTSIIAFFKIVAGLVVPIAVSLLLNVVRQELIQRRIQTLIYLPHFLSWIILGGILIDLLSPSTAIVNQMLGWVGIEPIYFLGDNKWFRFVLVLSDTWKDFGFSTIV